MPRFADALSQWFSIRPDCRSEAIAAFMRTAWQVERRVARGSSDDINATSVRCGRTCPGRQIEVDLTVAFEHKMTLRELMVAPLASACSSSSGSR